MKELYEKMQEYLQMDTEISYQEFSKYYQGVLDYFQANFDELEQEDLLKGKYIFTILSSNSASRALKKGPEMKKYKKIGEKTNFWSGAINYRLLQSGLTQEEIDEKLDMLGEATE